MKKIKIEWFDHMDNLKREEFLVEESFELSNIKDLVNVTLNQNINEENINMFETNLSCVGVFYERLDIVEINLNIGFEREATLSMSKEELVELKESFKLMKNNNLSLLPVIVYIDNEPIKIDNISMKLLKSVITLSFNENSVDGEMTQVERIKNILSDLGVTLHKYEIPLSSTGMLKSTDETININEIKANIEYQKEKYKEAEKGNKKTPII